MHRFVLWAKLLGVSGIPSKIGLGVTRVRTHFEDSSGNAKSFQGTGFWLRHGDHDLYVTNRHNVDHALRIGAESAYELRSVEIELRRNLGGKPTPETQFFRLANDSCMRSSASADCTVFVGPSFADRDPSFAAQAAALSPNGLADAAWLNDRIQMMDVASFVGFPGSIAGPWWDEGWNFPIARSCTIASLPEVPYTNREIRTTDVTLVAGFSFTGSSGSPVIAHQKGFRIAEPLTGGPEFVPAKVLGIMSGSFWESAAEPEMFRHTGLSYFTRSTAILELVSDL
jgi:hypothetical protein